MKKEFSDELERAKHTIEEIRIGQRVSHRDISDAYAHLLVDKMATVLDETEMVITRAVLYELWRVKMLDESLEYFFRLCMEYEVEIPSELIHTGIFGRASSTFAGELSASYRRALINYGIDVPI